MLKHVEEYDGPGEYSFKNDIINNENENFVYLLKNEKILKLLVTADSQILRESFVRLLQILPRNDFETVDLNELEKQNFPIDNSNFSKKIGKRYRIPKRRSINCDLIYILNSIYNSTSINSDQLRKLSFEYEYCNMCRDERLLRLFSNVIENIINNLNVEILEEYDYNDLSNKEKTHSFTDLKNLKQIIVESLNNVDIFDNLKIRIPSIEAKQLIK